MGLENSFTETYWRDSLVFAGVDIAEYSRQNTAGPDACCGTGPLTVHLVPRGPMSCATRELGVRKTVRDLRGATFWVYGQLSNRRWPRSPLGPAPSSGLAGCQRRRAWVLGDTSNVEVECVVDSRGG